MAWIEIRWAAVLQRSALVATREGGVDRNCLLLAFVPASLVATREGGVDRNASHGCCLSNTFGVATREGGVDRNYFVTVEAARQNKSPPARVAWIEISGKRADTLPANEVATREGGVDRNGGACARATRTPPSPPARVAWIEM